MPQITIEVSELHGKDAGKVKELAEFLKERLNADAKFTEDKIVLGSEKGKEALSKTHLRVLIRRFLHKEGLKETFRLIAGEEDTFRVKKRKIYEEE